jgi:hypothetical protein
MGSMRSNEDQRLARAARLLRHRAGLRQKDLAGKRYVTQEIEAGRIGHLKVDVVRAHFAALDATVRLTPWWNGAALDRLLDEAHARVVDAVARILPGYGFKRVRTEYSFSEFGDRGSIDVFAANDERRAVFVGEAKSEWGSIEETLRRQDVKTRLASKLTESAFGWKPTAVASVLVFSDRSTNRRIAERYAASLGSYPARSRDIRAWLRLPTGSVGGIWFLSDAGPVGRGFGDSAEIG